MSRKTIATTRRMCSHPPSMVDVIIPRNHNTMSRMTRNISIGFLLGGPEGPPLRHLGADLQPLRYVGADLQVGPGSVAVPMPRRRDCGESRSLPPRFPSDRQPAATPAVCAPC